MTHLWLALAFIRICIHSVSVQPCDIYVDTMGVGFGYPFVNLLYGISIYSYTHYPIVNYDMLKGASPAKQVYYSYLIVFYQLCGHK